MNEDNFPSAREHQIWTTSKVSTMQSEPVAEPMGNFAHRDLRLRILAAYAAHHSGSCLLIYNVHPSPISSAFQFPLINRRPLGIA